MNEKIKAALQKINEDPDLVAKFNACRTPDECYEIAGGAEAGFTKEEFQAAMEALQTAVERSGELSDEDLGKIAGGVDWGDVSVIVGPTAVSGATAIAASAAAI